MGVVISKPAINIREQLTELKAQQGYEERQFHFDNLVTNGTFDTDTDWTKGTGWTISGGTAIHAAGSATLLTQSISMTLGKVYQATCDVVACSGGSGSIQFRGGGTTTAANIDATDVGSSVQVTYVAEGNTQVGVNAGSGTDLTVDNISVYEVDPADDKVIHTMPKGWKPLHVFEDGALQREGSAYDYTVEYDGFNYIVKETVAPVAPYSTTVIGVRA
jgi:hypothetical protein